MGRLAILLIVVAALPALAGCRDEDQGRPLVFHKGTYGGKPMPQVSDATRAQMRDRVTTQKF